MLDKLIIRKMTEEDYNYWMPLSVRLQADERTQTMENTTLEAQIDLVKKQLNRWVTNGVNTQGHFFYSLDYDKIKNIGFVWFAEYPDFPEKVILLTHIYVNKAYRGKGIAKHALEQLHKQIFNQGYNEIYLNVLKTNFAYNLYKKLGYKVFKTFDKNYHMSLKK